MPRGRPTNVPPWEREYWPELNKGQKLYSIQEWQVWRYRTDRGPEHINEHVCEELDIPSNWVCTKLRRLLDAARARIDDASEEDGDFRGFVDQQVQSPPDSPAFRGFDTPGLRRGRTRNYFDDRGESTETDETSDSDNSVINNSQFDIFDENNEQREVLDNIDVVNNDVNPQADIEAELDNDLLQTDPNDWCIHHCPKKHHMIVNNA